MLYVKHTNSTLTHSTCITCELAYVSTAAGKRLKKRTNKTPWLLWHLYGSKRSSVLDLWHVAWCVDSASCKLPDRLQVWFGGIKATCWFCSECARLHVFAVTCVRDMLTNVESCQVSCSCSGFYIPLSPTRPRGNMIFILSRPRSTRFSRKSLLFVSTRFLFVIFPDLTLVTNLCGLLLAQDILISSFVVGLLFHRGRGSVSDMLSEHLSVPLGFCLMSSDSHRLRLHFRLHRVYLFLII